MNRLAVGHRERFPVRDVRTQYLVGEDEMVEGVRLNPLRTVRTVR